MTEEKSIKAIADLTNTCKKQKKSIDELNEKVKTLEEKVRGLRARHQLYK